MKFGKKGTGDVLTKEMRNWRVLERARVLMPKELRSRGYWVLATKKWLAGELGITLDGVYKMLGRKDWHVSSCANLAKVLKVSPAYLIWKKATMKGGFRGTTENRKHEATDLPVDQDEFSG